MINRTKKIFTLSLTFFVVSLLCLLGVIFTSIFFEDRLNKEMMSLKLENDKMSNLKEINNMLKETEEKRSYIASLFTDKESVIDFLALLESVGDKSGADVSVVSVSEETKVGFAGGNRIKLRIEGTWNQVFRSIYLLDNVPATFSIKNLSLLQSESDEKIKTKVWQADIEALVFKSESIK